MFIHFCFPIETELAYIHPANFVFLASKRAHFKRYCSKYKISATLDSLVAAIRRSIAQSFLKSQAKWLCKLKRVQQFDPEHACKCT